MSDPRMALLSVVTQLTHELEALRWALGKVRELVALAEAGEAEVPTYALRAVLEAQPATWSVAEPVCPGCQGRPYIVLGGGSQAFCGNDDCHVFTWNPQASLAENFADVVTIGEVGEAGEGPS